MRRTMSCLSLVAIVVLGPAAGSSTASGACEFSQYQGVRGCGDCHATATPSNKDLRSLSSVSKLTRDRIRDWKFVEQAWPRGTTMSLERNTAGDRSDADRNVDFLGVETRTAPVVRTTTSGSGNVVRGTSGTTSGGGWGAVPTGSLFSSNWQAPAVAEPDVANQPLVSNRPVEQPVTGANSGFSSVMDPSSLAPPLLDTAQTTTRAADPRVRQRQAALDEIRALEKRLAGLVDPASRSTIAADHGALSTSYALDAAAASRLRAAVEGLLEDGSSALSNVPVAFYAEHLRVRDALDALDAPLHKDWSVNGRDDAAARQAAQAELRTRLATLRTALGEIRGRVEAWQV